jgi:hypothetical protein
MQQVDYNNGRVVSSKWSVPKGLEIRRLGASSVDSEFCTGVYEAIT